MIPFKVIDKYPEVQEINDRTYATIDRTLNLKKEIRKITRNNLKDKYHKERYFWTFLSGMYDDLLVSLCRKEKLESIRKKLRDVV